MPFIVCYETYKLRSLQVNLLMDNILVDGLGFQQEYLPPSLTGIWI